MKRVIENALQDYSEDDLKRAISNYAEIINGTQYYFKYKWTLIDFLSRKNGNNIERFLDLNAAKDNFSKKEGDRVGAVRTNQKVEGLRIDE